MENGVGPDQGITNDRSFPHTLLLLELFLFSAGDAPRFFLLVEIELSTPSQHLAGW